MKINNKVFSYYILSQDHLYTYLTKEDVFYFVKESENIAETEAVKYDLDLIYRAIKNENIAVKYSDEINNSERSILETNGNAYTITIFKNSIDYLASIQSELSKKDIVDMLLVHEFYHYLEYKNNCFTNELLNRLNYRVGFIKRKSSILKTREIAAHHFAFLVTNMKHHPVYYDCIQSVLSGACNKIHLEDEMMQLERNYVNENSKLSR